MRLKLLIFITIYMILVTMLANSLLITADSEIAQNIALADTELSWQYFKGLMSVFINLATFQISGVPAPVTLILYDLPIIIVMYIIIDMLAEIF